jgi:endonuclease/exonuclease/phosphatase family metal-dependent hydrolase
VKFIQLNIFKGNLIRYAIKFLRKENADIINLQEVSKGMGTNNMDYFCTYEKLQDDLKYEYSFYSPKTGGRFGVHFVSEGQLILSKYPIIYKKAVYTQGKPNLQSGFVEKKNLKMNVLQHVKIKIDSKIVNDLNYHGYLIWGTRAGNGQTESNSKKILNYMSSIDQNERIILSGDFNLSPKSRSLRMISRSYPDLISKYKIKTTRNELSFEKTPVDNILVNRQVKVKSLKVPMTYISDHLPLVMSFD